MIARMRLLPDTSRVPVIVVSTEGSETRITKFREAGIEFVHKPFTPVQLRDVVLRVTGAAITHDDALAPHANDSLDF
jgi:two-component system chemotaxis response regulator CheY